MITLLTKNNGSHTLVERTPEMLLAPANDPDAQDSIWIDLRNPPLSEDKWVEQILGFPVPTREDMGDIEPSSRLYTENGQACVMTTSLPLPGEGGTMDISPITFILTPKILVTARYSDPPAFKSVLSRATRIRNDSKSVDIFFLLVGASVDKISELLEKATHDLDDLSNAIFRNSIKTPDADTPPVDLQQVITRLGQIGDVNSKVRECLVSLARFFSFLSSAASWLNAEQQEHIKTLIRDVRFLGDHADFLNTKVNFLLDATLGLIDIEQTKIIKIFSVAATVFLPPTLIASVYGMNFHFMPELDKPWGYPLSVFLMLLSAIGPYFYFKRKNWL
ncbi:MAG: magnesium transporter CorA family protein [Dongiaceae bacterium]